MRKGAKRLGWYRVLIALVAMMVPVILMGQPGGGPGGRPSGGGGFGGPGGPGGPGGRPPFDRDGNRSEQRGQTVRQKTIKTKLTTYKVVGTLVDSTRNESMMYVTVMVLKPEDSSLVKGSITDADGYFEVGGLSEGKYLMKVSALGYQTLMFPFSVENNTALGTLRMHPGATTMKEVKITAARPLYAMDGEKLVYNVTEDPSVQDGTTSDALQNAPGVEVDIEGNITLRGVSSVEIWINDRPSKLNAENLKTYLETLPANALDRIETITNPSAKYATEAEAVINIITTAHIKKNHFISFGANGSSQPQVSPWMSYMWANEKLSINLFASGRYSKSSGSSSDTSAYSPFNADSSAYILTERDTSSSRRESDNWGMTFSANFDYYIDSMRNLSGWSSFNFNGTSSDNTVDMIRDRRFVPTQHLYHYFDTTSGSNRSSFGMAGLFYTRKFDENGHNLRLSARGNYSTSNSDQDYVRDYDVEYTPFLDERKYYYTSSSSYSLGVDGRYNRPLSEQSELTFGAGVDYDASHGQFERTYLDAAGADLSKDTLRSYRTAFSNAKANADAGWTRRFGLLTMQLGLGVGYQHYDLRYYDSPMPFVDDTAFNFFTVRPSVHLSYRTQSMHNFKLNYSMRMSNPSSQQLTTFRTYGEDSYSTGNRDLKASRTHSAEAGWTKFFTNFGSVGVEAYARYSAAEISSLTDAEDVIDEYLMRTVSFSMPYNMGSSYRVGTSLNMTYRPTGLFNVRLYANLYDYGYSMDRGAQGVLKDSRWSYSLRLNSWAKIYQNYQIYASANYSSPTIGLASERKARYNLNFGVRADFFKRKVSAFVHVQDIFNWGARYGSGSRNTNPAYTSNSTDLNLTSRFISAGITFRFGKMELENKAKDGNSLDDSSSSVE